MRQPIVSPDKFLEWFNSKVPGAYRKITNQDVRDMTECGLIGRYGYYGRTDLETVRAILLYEQLRSERERKACLQDAPRTCKRCGKSLPENGNKKGRPKEYCQQCERYRNRDRYKEWKVRHGHGEFKLVMS